MMDEINKEPEENVKIDENPENVQQEAESDENIKNEEKSQEEIEGRQDLKSDLKEEEPSEPEKEESSDESTVDTEPEQIDPEVTQTSQEENKELHSEQESGEVDGVNAGAEASAQPGEEGSGADQSDKGELKGDSGLEPKSESKTEKKESAEEKTKSSDDDQDGEEHEEDILEAVDLESASKKELLDLLKKFSHVANMKQVDRGLKELHPCYEKLFESEKEVALKDFIEKGGNEGDFDYKGDETDRKFFELYDLLRDRKHQYFSKLEAEKEENLKRKNELLDQLRELVDGEESTASIDELKALQAEWRKIGHIPGPFVKTMWANYHALIDRFYDHRSIYFELKELDRQKNLKGKLDLCERAEALDKLENIKDAVLQLNELHEEFKHIGPIPKADQEPVWQRFKAASDKVYAKRRDFYEEIKKDQFENKKIKEKLGEEAATFVDFNSDKISDWNKKTKEILDLQKRWEATGSLPKEHAKVINKKFWSNFKTFFNNKNQFFKQLEGMREENLKIKQDLVAKAEEVKDSNEWDKTSNLLKKLQSDWKEIGPVPEKYREEVYRKFKAACDHFFEKRRSQNQEKFKEFEENLKKKEEVCAQLEACMQADTINLDDLYDLLDHYAEIGFVPRNSIKTIHQRFDKITNQLISLEELTDEQRNELRTHVQVNKLKGSPHGGQKINRKENAIRRKISHIENDISTWKTNIEFFANSKTADQLKDDFNNKIASAEKELNVLKKQLEVLNQS